MCAKKRTRGNEIYLLLERALAVLLVSCKASTISVNVPWKKNKIRKIKLRWVILY